MKYIFPLLLLFSITISFAQSNDQKSLLKQANEAQTFLTTEPEKAYKNAKKIEAEARKIKAQEAELKSIEIQYKYYKINSDFNEMMQSAQKLSLKATAYNALYYQVTAKRYLFESYFFTGLPEKAFNELEEGNELANKLDKKDSLNAKERFNFYIAYANFYLLNEDHKNQLKYIKLAGVELKNLVDSNYKKKVLPIHYSNLASSFMQNKEMDSARFYANLSQNLPKVEGSHQVKFNNLMVLGQVEMNRGNYKEALESFKEAEGTISNENHLNIELLFRNIAEVYKQMDGENLARQYRMKQDSIKLIISEIQNKSLHNLLKEKKEVVTGRYLYIPIISIVILILIIFLVVRKNKILKEQENTSNHFLEEFAKKPTGEDYSKLLDLLKGNDPAFMSYFEKSFPNFSTQLLAINPDLSSSDIEFCALVKLKLSTKEIAQYIFRAPQTIRNKKYIIKNKLGIPKDIDLYEWFDTI